MTQRIADWLLAVAARRWPAHLREEMSREWAGELYALGHEESAVAALRKWRQLRFAASLALARPPGADPVPLPRLPRPSPTQIHAGWLFLAPLFVLVTAAMAVSSLAWPTDAVARTPMASVITFFVVSYVAYILIAAVVGTLLARRLLRRRAGRPVSPAGCGWATLPVTAGLLTLDVLARSANRVWDGSWFAVVVALCLSVLLPPVAAGVAALSRRRRLVSAVGLAVLAAPALMLVSAYTMVLVAPQTPAEAAGQPWWWLTNLVREPILLLTYDAFDTSLPIEAALAILPNLTLVSVVLALAHAIRLARPIEAAATSTSTAPDPGRGIPGQRGSERISPTVTSPTVTSTGLTSQTPAVARGPWWHRTALAGAVYSVLAWAVTLAYLTPNIGVQNSWTGPLPNGSWPSSEPAGWQGWSTQEGRVWMHELQLCGIVCAALCLLCAAAYRGRPLRPTLAGSVVLLGVNMVVVRGGWADARLLPWLAAGGLVVGIVVWAASTRPAMTRRPPARPRRLVVTITVLAAFLVPGGFLARLYIVPGVSAPPSLLLVAVGLPTVLTVIAVMGVLATSRRRPRRPFWRLPTALALTTAVGGVLFFQYTPEPTLNGQRPLIDFLVVTLPVAFAVPAAAWAVVGIHSRSSSPRRVGLHLLLTVPLLIVGFLITPGTVFAALALSRLALFPMEYGRAYDGITYLPGAIAVGLLLGYVAATRLDRARSAPATAPDTHDSLAPAQHPSA
ncbi:hypothetical protein O7543_15190 [Solwaraspora sp. WMMA2080]|uniref:hypothetical protein n=1 Tax=Solwaraspora sp. WMMA2080 TaxID=3015165 RepID=UPI00248BDBFD|nr:hypothetical protein [Solwaraspora sp. WMMA2080]WBC18314.1 hypothetical protein O7543_15190 [Solwaraspora sp. WMMA2080]